MRSGVIIDGLLGVDYRKDVRSKISTSIYC
jgi:NAD(P)H-hydrate repair Nnr-like enzyme with NAD(P)H-hydrate epimerase domain